VFVQVPPLNILELCEAVGRVSVAVDKATTESSAVGHVVAADAAPDRNCERCWVKIANGGDDDDEEQQQHEEEEDGGGGGAYQDPLVEELELALVRTRFMSSL
jgi:hypothetical protein